ncbi:MAG: DNA mismatch repair endonuclease MutL [Phycisphaerales bacterium]|nr:DNA mismatch repair endonuclease MutL [Phycisphaerales bacterium]
MERNPIQQLPEALVNRIAAGEVIERPASVVKELVENSIDAGASQVIVEIEDGGRELIRVIDDGCGIPPEQLPLAFAPHATSKIASDEDLFRIATLGFRGEALASIGSVSHARIVSRVPEASAVAYEVSNRGGQVSDPQAAAGNPGTTVEVRHLFFNVPARRKFLRGAQTEYGYIYDQLLRTALPLPHIAFKLLHNGRLALHLPPSSPQERWLCAWPDEFRQQWLPVEAADAEIRLRGIVGLPELARPVMKYQYFYLNNRPIRDKTILHAFRESYRGLTEPGRYPAGVLLLSMPPQDVDVNVHPTKAEVRFRDSGRIHGLVLSAVREQLLGSDLTPRAVPANRPSIDSRERASMRQQLADFFRTVQPAVTQPVLPLLPDEPRSTEGSLKTVTGLQANHPPTSEAPISASAGPEIAASGDSPASSSSSVGCQSSQRLPGGLGTGTAPVGPGVKDSVPARSLPADQPLPRSPVAEGGRREVGRAIQLHNSYLVAETEDGMIIIDQHALHERVIFEELLTRITRGPLESQRLLIPLVFSAGATQIELIEQMRALLERLGIELSPVGPDRVAVQGFPSFLHRLDPGEFVRELLERAEQQLLGLTEEQLLHEVLDMMACKAAVKAGEALSAEEIAALLARRELVERASNCPHGRPTTLRLSLRDLEKQFKRTGF